MEGKKITLVDRIYLDLLSKINSGEYENGYKLPTERELCEAYGVSRITAQHAVLRLVEDGLVTRNKRGGSVVGKNGAFGKPVVIPIVLPYVDDMIHGFLYGAQKQALDFGYTIKAFYSHDDPLKERKILQKFATPPPPGSYHLPLFAVRKRSRHQPVVFTKYPHGVRGSGNYRD